MANINLTKIIATMSPILNIKSTIRDLINQGVTIFRINFSHGTEDEHRDLIKNLREVGKDLKKVITICLDTKGQEFRINLVDSSEINVKENDILTFSNKKVGGSIYVPIEDFSLLDKSDLFYLDDGFLALEIVESGNDCIKGRARNSHRLKNNKKANFPGVYFSNKFVDINNKKDIKFGIENDVDIIFASFVNNKDSVLSIKEDVKYEIPVFAKIETLQGIRNIDEIISVSDGIMVARGDLGVETGFIELFRVQKNVSKKTILMNKPVICATQMLESMVTSTIPLRSEISDIGNAVTDGYDALMLSGETAIGENPLLSTDYMRKIIANAEEYVEKDTEIIKGCPFIGKDKGNSCIIMEVNSLKPVQKLHSKRLGVPIYVISSDKKLLSISNIHLATFPLIKDSRSIDEISRILKKDQGYKKVFKIVFDKDSDFVREIHVI
ncbi:hypothetical protein P3W45_000528 [Vairimorpha bombi]|jgi:pyruvate kinase